LFERSHGRASFAQLFLTLAVLDVDAQLFFDLGDLVDAPLMPAAAEGLC
jgi:hypothetical protein